LIDFEVKTVILVGIKNKITIIATHNHMLGMTGQDKTWETCHGVDLLICGRRRVTARGWKIDPIDHG